MQKVIERWSDFSLESEFSDVESEDSGSDSSEDEIEEQATKMIGIFGRILYNYNYNYKHISLQSKNECIIFLPFFTQAL